MTDPWVCLECGLPLLGSGTMKLLGLGAKKRFAFLRDDLTVQ